MLGLARIGMSDFLYGATSGGTLEFRWNREFCRVSIRPRGTTGFAEIHRRSGGVKHDPPELCRVHLCRNNPCDADWKPSKYGVYGEPIHVQPLVWTHDLEADLNGDAAESSPMPPEPPPAPPPPEPPPTSCHDTEEVQVVNADEPEPCVSAAVAAVPGAGEDGAPAVAAAVPEVLEEEMSADVAAVPAAGDVLVPAAVAAMPEAIPQCEPASAPLRVLRPGEATDAVLVVPRPVSPAALVPSLPANHQNKLLTKVLQLARSIRTARSYVGYAAFVCFALCKHLLVHMWEGSVRVNLIQVYAPWALDDITAEPACDGICCCSTPAVAGGAARWRPVSEKHPLNEVKHYVAGVGMGQSVTHDTTTLEGFYNAIGIALLGTVTDGDCGIDTMCIMAGLQQTAAQRLELREDIYQYIIQRVEEPRLHDLLLACAELSMDDVERYRKSTASGHDCGDHDAGEGLIMVADADSPAVAGESAATQPITEELRKALQWATSVNDDCIIKGLVAELPLAVQHEQLALYNAHQRESAVADVSTTTQIVVYPHRRSSRMQVATLFDRFLVDHDLTGRKLPKGMLRTFMSRLTWASAKSQCHPRSIRRWHMTWLEAGAGQQIVHHRRTAAGNVIANRSRLRPLRQMPRSCPWLRTALYEWFVSLRYSVDWKAVAKSAAPQLRRKVMARFTRSFVKAKAKQLLQLYLRESLTRGLKTKGVDLRSRWFRAWEAEHGLNMKKPNRKYKVPKAVLAERLEIGWLNAVRVRALCVATHGYDLEFENFDESPFHNNESGSKDVYTLAVAGKIVPLVEGHADTRERWTANLTTWSNKRRILQEGPPYAEFMFKGSGEILKKRLQEHIRSRGVGSWASATTSEKASYRVDDILDFLERHLPQLRENRKWRIMQADDAKAHLSPNVFRLCWNRGYVFLPHGGGVTPVVQTVDTDLNQPVSREYQHLEVLEHMRQMQSGASVPCCKPEQCIDNMVGVLNKKELHVHAADGFLKTGWLCSLDDAAGDEQIVREASYFWKELNMRAKISAAVAAVRTEVAAGRLQWTQRDVQRLIKPYPRRGKVDVILENIGDDAGNDHARQSDDQSSAGDDLEDDDGDRIDDGDGDNLSADDSKHSGTDDDKHSVDECDDAQPSAVAGDSKLSKDDIIVSAEEAECIVQSRKTIAALELAKQTCEQVGSMTAVVHIENEIRKAERTLRQRTSENPDLLRALAQTMDMESAEAAKRKRLVDEANAQTLSAKKLKQQIQEANAKLRSTKQAVLDAEAILEAKHAAKSFTIADLGGGGRSGGHAKKQRLELLDRLSRIGPGLSAPQRNDFAWFKNAWDAKMSGEHGDAWPHVLAGWVQTVLNDFDGGISNAFSVFVRNETIRNFSETLALRVPGAS